MKKGKSRHKRKKSRLLWIAIAVIGMAAITAAVCVAGMFKKEDVWKTPEELLVEYMNHIPAQEYEQMYAIGGNKKGCKRFSWNRVCSPSG